LDLAFQLNAIGGAVFHSSVFGFFESQEYIGIVVSVLDRQNRTGICFLGYHFGPEGLAIAQKTLDNFVERATRIYEQGPGEPCGSTRLGECTKRWVRWVGAGLGIKSPFTPSI